MMKALLDTNIVIHREANNVVNQHIGTLFKWLDKAKYEKYIHPITVEELRKYEDKNRLNTLSIKIQSYSILNTIAPLATEVQEVSIQFDTNQNDKNDTQLLNALFQGRVDILITEDKKIHNKAAKLDIQDKVFKINGFLEKVISENPSLINYDVLSVVKKYFGNIDIQDSFFNSFREDYEGFNHWFNKKAEEVAYVTYNDSRILSFLYLKKEDETENYMDIVPPFVPKKRLKIGTFKVVSNGVRLGERFLKIIFDNAIRYKVDEIYVTIFDKTEEQKRLIDLLKEWGFVQYGIKKSKRGDELVLIRDFSPCAIPDNPKISYPFISKKNQILLCPIYPQYHTELFPDSILTTESSINFKENFPHRNALSKVYISRSLNQDIGRGDIIVFYRTGGFYKGVVTTIGIIENVIKNISSEDEFVLKCRKRSIFSDEDLKEHWNYTSSNRPFIVNFLYVYSFPKRLNLAKLIELGIIADSNSAPRGFVPISQEQFYKIIQESQSDESLIVD